MERVSTNLTLFFKFFVPIFWIVFVGAFTIALQFTPLEYGSGLSPTAFRLLLVLFFATGVLVLSFTLLRLKRVEISSEMVYVTNYFKNVRYPYHNIENISISRFFILTFVRVKLKVPGSFGKSFFFIASTERLNAVLQEFSSLSSLVH
jgi:hypothetical protein